MSSLTIVSEDTNYANATYTALSDFIAKGASYLGCNLSANCEKNMTFFSKTGGLGMAPALALGDDLSQLGKTLEKDFSLGRTITQLSVSTEVFADLYELASSVGDVTGSVYIKTLSDQVATIAMQVKTAGAFPLAFSSLDELYAQLTGRIGFLGSIPVDDEKQFERVVSAALRATEVTSAMLSTGALLVEGKPGTLFVVASTVSNVAKIARMTYSSKTGL